jgi:hypothetical protein
MGNMPSYEEGRYWDNEYHVKMKVSGNKKKISLFHFILSDADKDYPYKDGKEPKNWCHTCCGAIYQFPRFKPTHLLALGKQISECDLLPGHLKVKIKRYCKAETCKKDAQEKQKEKGQGEGVGEKAKLEDFLA